MFSVLVFSIPDMYFIHTYPQARCGYIGYYLFVCLYGYGFLRRG